MKFHSPNVGLVPRESDERSGRALSCACRSDHQYRLADMLESPHRKRKRNKELVNNCKSPYIITGARRPQKRDNYWSKKARASQGRRPKSSIAGSQRELRCTLTAGENVVLNRAVACLHLVCWALNLLAMGVPKAVVLLLEWLFNIVCKKYLLHRPEEQHDQTMEMYMGANSNINSSIRKEHFLCFSGAFTRGESSTYCECTFVDVLSHNSSSQKVVILSMIWSAYCFVAFHYQMSVGVITTEEDLMMKQGCMLWASNVHSKFVCRMRTSKISELWKSSAQKSNSCCVHVSLRWLPTGVYIIYMYIHHQRGLLMSLHNTLKASQERFGSNAVSSITVTVNDCTHSETCVVSDLNGIECRNKITVEGDNELNKDYKYLADVQDAGYCADENDSDACMCTTDTSRKLRKKRIKPRVKNSDSRHEVAFCRGSGDMVTKSQTSDGKKKGLGSSKEYEENGRKRVWCYQSPASAYLSLTIVGTCPTLCKPPTGYTMPSKDANLCDLTKQSVSRRRNIPSQDRLPLVGSDCGQADIVSADCAVSQAKTCVPDHKQAVVHMQSTTEVASSWRSRLKTTAELFHAGYYSQMLDILEGRHVSPPYDNQVHLVISFGCGLAYYKMKRFKQAIIHMTCFKHIAERQRSAADQSLAYLYLGDISSSMGNHKTASDHYGMALQMYGTDCVAKEYRIVMPTEAAMWLKQASSFKLTSRVFEAVQSYKNSLSKSSTKKEELSAHTSLGNLYQTMGDNASAKEEYLHTIQLAQEVNDMVALGWAHSNIGNAYLALHQRDKALYHLHQSLDYAVQYEQTPQAIGRVYNNIGTAFQALDQLEKAEEYYDLSLSQAIYGSDTNGQARVYGNIANLLMLRKQYHRAVSHFSEVLTLTKDRITVSTVHHNRGIAYFEWAESKKSTLLNKIAYVMPVFLIHCADDKASDCDHAPPNIPSSILKYYKQGVRDLLEVVQSHEHSLETIKGSEKGLSLSVSLFENNYRAFHRLQDCYVSMGESFWLQALERAEQCRARTLGELMLKQKSWALKQPLNTPLDLDQIRGVVMKQSTPVLYLSYTGIQLLLWLLVPSDGDVSSAMIQVPLKDDQFDGKSFEYHMRYQLTEQIVEKNIDMYKQLDHDDSLNQLVEALHDVIGKPIQTLVDILHVECAYPQEVIVVPDSYTSLLPLNCLLDKSNMEFLGDRYIFRVMPSFLTMTVLNELPEVEIALHRDKMCVVGNPTIPIFSYKNETLHLGKLPYAAKEAECVANILKCLPLLHEQATKSAVIMRMMNAKVIHLATHGSASSGFLAFAHTSLFSAQEKNTDDSKSILLHPQQVEKLAMSPALVVLSSCDSGRGTIMADGIQGMARAFLVAGAQAVLTSLWKVPDESACIFMQYFYQYLVDGFKSSHALHKAVLSLRCFSKYSQYIHWSGYQLTGRDVQFERNQCDNTPLSKTSPGSVFPRLDIVMKLKTVLISDPCLPTDVQVVRGVPGVVPSEPVKDFIHNFHDQFKGGIFWLSCKNAQLIRASVNQIKSVSTALLVPSEVAHSLVILDDLVTLVDLPTSIIPLLQSHNVHIIIISKHNESPDSLYREIDKELIRGCNVHSVEPLSMVHSTQRIVYSVLSEHHLAPARDDQASFMALSDMACGSAIIADSISALLLTKMNKSSSNIHRALGEVAQALKIKIGQYIMNKDCQSKDYTLRNVAQVELDVTLNCNDQANISQSIETQVKPASNYVQKRESDVNHDSWHVIGSLLNLSHLSHEELLVLYTLSLFDSAPVPMCVVNGISAIVTKAAHIQHQAGSILPNLEGLKLIKKYPAQIVFHPSMKEMKRDYDLVYVPHLIGSAILNEVMQEIDKIAALGLLYKVLCSIQNGIEDAVMKDYMHGLMLISLKVYELHFEIIGKDCFQAVYMMCLSSVC